ncbi:MAG: cyclase family protein [Candidatus Abyssobacteria bacterium SURF_17]|jgi:kynurenine formamidase|uniref:Cyclase family protein n=1 Tax=Candidatus Abyssobacteria bacterium SURF_17 TaxID=2093361 RepID=A0A419EW17_9BACT|nr:MAG: cyclase family protein [Candidatus Abyssubacteria bacterium SURF_17]
MKWKARILSTILVALLFVSPVSAEEPKLWKLQKVLASKKYVDLTHAFHPDIPHWKGFPVESVKDIYTYERGGFWAQEFTHVGQWGTHVDPPAHFHKGLRTVDELSLKEMILPLVVVDVHEKVAQNPDYVLSLADVKEWETRNGEIPQGAFVAMRTDWSKRWPDAAAMANKDEHGIAHYPGWSVESLRFLLQERRVVAIGHEPTDTDPGMSTSRNDYQAESYVLGTNHYQIELLTNLDGVPEKGALIICTFPKPLKGSGFPARAFAVVP